jgi:hypothetical protein
MVHGRKHGLKQALYLGLKFNFFISIYIRDLFMMIIVDDESVGAFQGCRTP